jgi:hypothetical protein
MHFFLVLYAFRAAVNRLTTSCGHFKAWGPQCDKSLLKCESNSDYNYPLRTQLYPSDVKTQFVPRSKHSPSVIKSDKLMQYREIIAVRSESHAKHINELWAEHRISECSNWWYIK